VIPALQRRGFRWGGGMLSPDHSRFLLNIPKNASSYVSSWSGALGWSPQSCHNLPLEVKEMCVILRDPVERWISGMAQYLNGYILHVRGPQGPVFPNDPFDPVLDRRITAEAFIESYNLIAERFIFDQINRFDDHVWPQSELCADICVGMPRRYIMMDQQFDQHVSQYFDAEPMPDLYRNSGSDNPDQQALQEFLRDRLVKRPELRERVIKAYASDYDFIERAMNEMV
jgi:hypothetical protein